MYDAICASGRVLCVYDYMHMHVHLGTGVLSLGSGQCVNPHI